MEGRGFTVARVGLASGLVWTKLLVWFVLGFTLLILRIKSGGHNWFWRFWEFHIDFFLPDTDFWASTFSRLIMAATPKLNQTSGLIWTKLCRSKGQPTNHLLINNIINIYILFMLLRRKARCSNGTNITFLEKRRVENPIIIHRLSLNPKKHQEKLTPHQTTTKLLWEILVPE